MARESNRIESTLTKEERMPFVRRNYLYMLIGCLIVAIGFLLMIGGGSDDPNVFDESIFGFRQLTISPIVTLLGFGFVIYAILYRPKAKEREREA